MTDQISQRDDASAIRSPVQQLLFDAPTHSSVTIGAEVTRSDV